MLVEFPEDVSLRDAISLTKKAWLGHNSEEHESIVALAYKFKVSTRTIMRWKKGEVSIRESRPNSTNTLVCSFCFGKDDLHEHHTKGRQSNEVVFLCSPCHLKFHALNKKYPQKR